MIVRVFDFIAVGDKCRAVAEVRLSVLYCSVDFIPSSHPANCVCGGGYYFNVRTSVWVNIQGLGAILKIIMRYFEVYDV